METFGFFNPYAPVAIHERNLPHWQQPGALVFLTWRLADALPAEKLAEWEADLERWKSRHPPPWDAATTAEYRAQFPGRIERWLDAGEGECVLRRPEIAWLVEAALRHFDGERYEMRAYVIMPNHVHAVARLGPLNGAGAPFSEDAGGRGKSDTGERTSPSVPVIPKAFRLETIVQGWKSWTAREMNRALGRKGTVWQEGYWDRLVRDEKHLARCVTYIERNPVKARLCEGEFRLWVKERPDG